MPFVLIGIAIVLLVSGVNGTQKQIAQQLRDDLFGDKNFPMFVVAILAVGAIGYIPKAKGLSNAFLFLILVVLILSNGGVFNALVQQIEKVSS